jgi:hypothetical protein
MLEIWDDESYKCKFYTVRKEGAKNSETDKFFLKYSSNPELVREVQELLSFILESIGNTYGAIDILFNRYENQVIGLPNKGRVVLGGASFLFPNFPLRLYALRINDRSDMVVLFNGGRKTSQTNQGSRDLNLKWIEACLFAKRIEDALKAGEISIDIRNKKIIAADGGDEIVL